MKDDLAMIAPGAPSFGSGLRRGIHCTTGKAAGAEMYDRSFDRTGDSMAHSTTFLFLNRSLGLRRGVRLGALAIGLTLAGCAAERPVLYQSSASGAADPVAQQRAIDECMALAQQAGVGRNEAAEVGKQTAGAATVGAAGGAAAGAIGGHAGRGAAVGAAGAGAAGLTRGLLKSHGLDDLQKRYVETCLRERGYQTLGWR
jgi:hypothetical protein